MGILKCSNSKALVASNESFKNLIGEFPNKGKKELKNYKDCWCKYVFTIYTYLSLLKLMHYLFICIILFMRHLGVCVLSLSYSTHIGVCTIHQVVMLTTQISALFIWHMLSTT